MIANLTAWIGTLKGPPFVRWLRRPGAAWWCGGPRRGLLSRQIDVLKRNLAVPVRMRLLPAAVRAAKAQPQRIVMRQRCSPCHSAKPTDDQWKLAPNNVIFDTPEQIKMYSERIKSRAVISRTMPFGNKTGMTQDERDLLARWFFQGSPIE